MVSVLTAYMNDVRELRRRLSLKTRVLLERKNNEVERAMFHAQSCLMINALSHTRLIRKLSLR
jgi:hypothetical protein